MKRLSVLKREGCFILILTLLSTIVLSGCGSSKEPSEVGGINDGVQGEELADTLNIIIWTEYISDDIIKKFESEYNIRVNYDTFSSNEELLAKLSAGAAGYDLALSGDYMIEILRKQQRLLPINKDNIPNMKHLDEQYLVQSFDPGNTYSVPFMAGIVALAVNKETVQTEVTGYQDLWKPEFENALVVLDDQRILIGIANKIQGQSMNATDLETLEESQRILTELLPNIKVFDSDNAKVLLANGEVKAGITWGADVALAKRDNPSIEGVLPEEGINVFMDSFIIPVGAKNQRTAELFIDFILRPEISAEISEDFPYTNPNREARKLIDDDILNDPTVYPPEEALENGEYLIDIEDAILEYDRIWSELKLQ